MTSVKGKRLLVLGGTSASFDLVKNAREMGIYTIVTDDGENRIAKEIADEKAMVSTTDIAGLLALIKGKRIDGVFCGPSEFNLRNVINVCAESALPCYTTAETWEKCANKDTFKSYCKQYNVDCTPEYNIDLQTPESELEKIEYPIIIKPVDGCSSAGITVCRCAKEVKPALERAYSASKAKRVIAEKFIENGGEIFSVRYLLNNGEAYPYFMMDTYVADPIKHTSLISGLTYAPSKYADYYMERMDANVRKMLKGMGLKHGTAFIQSLPMDGKIYFHEMGYRLSGGMLFKLTEPLSNINDMKLMLRYAVGGSAVTEKEVRSIDLSCGGKIGAQLMIPLNAGTIGKIVGVENVKKHPLLVDFMQYYYVGDTVEREAIGTLGQHFCRITFIAESLSETVNAINCFQELLSIYDVYGNKMNQLPFDTKRLTR